MDRAVHEAIGPIDEMELEWEWLDIGSRTTRNVSNDGSAERSECERESAHVAETSKGCVITSD
jgi:hypothetical protein